MTKQNKYTPGRIDIISMGCSKNLVDSERLIKRLKTRGYFTTHDSDYPEGEYVVVNTCGFIADAKEESINLILELAKRKSEGQIGNLIVMGCLSERYLKDLPSEIPEVDKWYGKFDWNNFIDSLPDKSIQPAPEEWERSLTTPSWSAYLKISEGCNRYCAFCAIPIITGKHKSRPIDEILEEVKTLVKDGVKEFNVIAQDLSSYGTDIQGRHLLAELIDNMAEIPGVEWIRLHYAYPADFPIDILDVMNKHDNVCKYIDIALQHIANPVLKNMRRHINKDETLRLLKTIREKVPGIKIRTTLMVGFPGEGEEEYEELLEFVRTQKFDRMGAFAYCEEEDTFAAKNLVDNIPHDIKQRRLEKLMELQTEISTELNEERIGEKVKVLIEKHEGDNAIGRSQWDSPEVDPEVIVLNCHAKPGTFIEAEVVEALPFELIAKTFN